MAPVLDLFKNTVAAVDVNDRGALHLTFADSTEIFIDPDPQYESWHLGGWGSPVSLSDQAGNPAGEPANG